MLLVLSFFNIFKILIILYYYLNIYQNYILKLNHFFKQYLNKSNKIINIIIIINLIKYIINYIIIIIINYNTKLKIEK